MPYEDETSETARQSQKRRRKRYRQKYPEKGAERCKQWRDANKDKAKAYAKERYAQGFNRERKPETLARYEARVEAALEAAAGRPRATQCDICRRVGKTQFDHDHETGLFRGWLCGSCNKTIERGLSRRGYVQAIVEYLENHEKRIAEMKTEVGQALKRVRSLRAIRAMPDSRRTP